MKLCNKQNSIIGCQDQTLGETIPIEGSALTLNYQSKRTPGYMEKSRITVPVTKPTFKPSTFIRSVEVKSAPCRPYDREIVPCFSESDV